MRKVETANTIATLVEQLLKALKEANHDTWRRAGRFSDTQSLIAVAAGMRRPGETPIMASQHSWNDLSPLSQGTFSAVHREGIARLVSLLTAALEDCAFRLTFRVELERFGFPEQGRVAANLYAMDIDGISTSSQLSPDLISNFLLHQFEKFNAIDEIRERMDDGPGRPGEWITVGGTEAVSLWAETAIEATLKNLARFTTADGYRQMLEGKFSSSYRLRIGTRVARVHDEPLQPVLERALCREEVLYD